MNPNTNRYFETFSAAEYQQTFFLPPKRSTLRKLREKAPVDFIFIIKAWQVITHEPTSPSYKRMPSPLDKKTQQNAGHFKNLPFSLEAYEKVRQSAKILDSPAVIFETPASFTPSQNNIEQMRLFFKTIERDNRLLIWEPFGLWSPDDILPLCNELNLLPSIDPLTGNGQQPSPKKETIAYFKIQGFGTSSILSDAQLYQIAQMLSDYSKAFCIFNSSAQSKDASRLLSFLE